MTFLAIAAIRQVRGTICRASRHESGVQTGASIAVNSIAVLQLSGKVLAIRQYCGSGGRAGL